MEYVRKSCNHILIINGKEAVLQSNDTLLDNALCNKTSLKCIMGVCSQWKKFPKIDDLKIDQLKCSKSCVKENNDCKSHTVKVKQFERVTYMHKEKEKKKLQLVDKSLTPCELVELLKSKLVNFARHRFNVQHTSKTYDQVVSNLTENMLFKIHDFSENYTCLLPEEIQSLHWNQETATVYPVVVLRRVGDDIREDHIAFISKDKQHVPSVEYCNNILHNHYEKEGLSINHDIEYNDGCASQFKCIRA